MMLSCSWRHAALDCPGISWLGHRLRLGGYRWVRARAGGAGKPAVMATRDAPWLPTIRWPWPRS
jgi:hypothetical protein